MSTPELRSQTFSCLASTFSACTTNPRPWRPFLLICNFNCFASNLVSYRAEYSRIFHNILVTRTRHDFWNSNFKTIDLLFWWRLRTGARKITPLTLSKRLCIFLETIGNIRTVIADNRLLLLSLCTGSRNNKNVYFT